MTDELRDFAEPLTRAEVMARMTRRIERLALIIDDTAGKVASILDQAKKMNQRQE